MTSWRRRCGWCRWHSHCDFRLCGERWCRQSQLLSTHERSTLLRCRWWGGQVELRFRSADARAASADAARVTGQLSIRSETGIRLGYFSQRIVTHITAKNLHHHALYRYLKRPIQVGYPEQPQMQRNHTQTDTGPGAVRRKRMNRKQRPCHPDMFPQLLSLPP